MSGDHPLSTKYETELQNIANDKKAKLMIKSMLTSRIVEFPAFLTSFSQTFTSNWNEEEVYGRMDPIATFQGTSRSISLGFDLPSPNVQVAVSNLQACDILMQFLYPGYLRQGFVGETSQNSTTNQQFIATTARSSTDFVQLEAPGHIIARPPLVAVKYANLIGGSVTSGQLGYLSGLEWSPSIDMGMFASGGKLYPKVISLSFTLNVLHQGERGFGSQNQWLGEQPFFDT